MGFWASLPRPPLGYCTLVALAVEVAVSVVVVAALPFVNLFLTSSVSSSATLAILQSAISCCYFFCFLVSLHFVAVALDSCSMPFPLLLLSLLLMACLCKSVFFTTLFHVVLMDSVGHFASLVAFLR